MEAARIEELSDERSPCIIFAKKRVWFIVGLLTQEFISQREHVPVLICSDRKGCEGSCVQNRTQYPGAVISENHMSENFRAKIKYDAQNCGRLWTSGRINNKGLLRARKILENLYFCC